MQSGPWMARARDSVVDDWIERLYMPLGPSLLRDTPRTL